MSVKLLSVMILFSLFSLYATADEPSVWLKVKAQDKFERSRLANLGFALELIHKDYVEILGTFEDQKLLDTKGFDLIAVPLSLKVFDFPEEDSNFHNYQELTAELQQLSVANPDLIHLISIGESIEGRPIHQVILTHDPSTHSKKPAVIFMGGHHAREHLSIEMPLMLIQRLVEKYREGDSRIVELIRSRTLYIIPMVNPDGAEYDIATGEYQWWRKNRRRFESATGVDLNRNYSYMWNKGGSSSNPRSDVYHGPSPFSEPETQAIKDWIDQSPNISILLSFHSFSELILYPWGHTYDPISDDRAFQVHKVMAETMSQWNQYIPQQAADLVEQFAPRGQELLLRARSRAQRCAGGAKLCTFHSMLGASRQWSNGSGRARSCRTRKRSTVHAC